MKSYTVGSPVTVTIPLIDHEGDPVTATALSYVIEDAEEEILAGPTAIAGPYETDAVIAVPADLNGIPGARTVRLTITAATGIYTQEQTYVLRPVVRLMKCENTFQTYASALILGSEIPSLMNWMGATKDRQQSALIEAFHRLCRHNYAVPPEEAVDSQDRLNIDEYYRLTPQMWPLMTLEEFEDYPEAFRVALNKAQVVEANDILSSSKISEKRRAGLMSETIGESSMMFRPGVRPLETKCSRAALAYVARYLDNRVSLTRS